MTDMDMERKVLGLSSSNGKPVPLKSTEVSVNIKGYLAEVTSRLDYSNEEADPIEACFTFPVDDGSAVYQFEAHISGRHIIAEIQEKEQAVLTYNDAKESGKTAMLLKEDNASGDIFQCMLGNLPPRTDAQLTMSYVIELPQEADGHVRFTLPTVLNPRYSPDAGSSVAAEGATYSPPCSIPYKFKMNAVVEGYRKVLTVTSDKLKLNVQFEDGGQKAKVDLGDEFKFDHDLCLYVKYAEPFTPQVIMENGNPAAEGLLKEDMLMVSFHPDLKEVSMASTGEYIFVIDRSGSMTGDKIKNAKEALLLFLKSLPPDCYFNIISFGSSFSSLFSNGCKQYTEKTLKQALDLQKSMEADMGGTEVYKPLEHVFTMKVVQQPRCVLLMTDGDVGNTDQVIALVKKHSNKSRLFALGIGQGVSTSLVKGVVRAGNGTAEFITDQARIQPKVVSLLKCAMQPAITNVEIGWDLPPDVKPISIPDELPAMITVGERLTLFAMLQGVDMHTIYAPSSVILKGTQDNKPVSYQLTFTLADDDKESRSAPVHRLATKAQIKILQDKEAALCEDTESYWDRGNRSKEIDSLRHQIVEVSRHGNIISKFSSFVAVDKEGAKVEGDLKERSCPVPTLSPEFLKGIEEERPSLRMACFQLDNSARDICDLKSYGLMDSGLMGGYMSMDTDIIEQSRPMAMSSRSFGGAKSPKPSFTAGIGSKLSKMFSFSEGKKKKTSYAPEIERDSAPPPPPPALSEPEIHCNSAPPPPPPALSESSDKHRGSGIGTKLKHLFSSKTKVKKSRHFDDSDECDGIFHNTRRSPSKSGGGARSYDSVLLLKEKTGYAGLEFDEEFEKVYDKRLPSPGSGSVNKTKSPDAVMLEVLSLQELHGQWKYCDQLQGLLNIPAKDLKTTDIVKEQTVLVTLVVVAWLRKQFAHRHDEWQMIETKALNWLSKQDLGNTNDELLKQVAAKFWP